MKLNLVPMPREVAISEGVLGCNATLCNRIDETLAPENYVLEITGCFTLKP